MNRNPYFILPPPAYPTCGVRTEIEGEGVRKKKVVGIEIECGRLNGALQLLSNRHMHIRFAHVHERFFVVPFF